MREEHGLAAKAAQERAKKSPLVKAVLPVMQGISGNLEICRGRDPDNAMEFRGRVGAEVSGELEHQISTHGVADKRDGLQLLRIAEKMQHALDIARETGVIEGGREP